jgi:hypothetical protein
VSSQPPSLATIATIFGVEHTPGARSLNVPGPGHSEADRSLSIKLDPAKPDGFAVYSFAGDDPIQCRDYVRERLGMPKWQPNGAGGGHAVEYIYRQADGIPYLRVTRTYKNGRKTFWQAHWDVAENQWVKGKPEGPKVPYRLPELVKSKVIFVVEGEKDADRLAALGLTATTNSEGADDGKGNKWTEDLGKWFAGKTVYVLPDNDLPGRRHADHVAAKLAPVAREVRVVALPDQPEKADVSDWLDRGGSKDDLIALCRAAPKCEARKFAGLPLRAHGERPLAATRWLIRNRLPETGVALLSGQWGTGKTFTALDIAGCVMHGIEFSGERVLRRGGVLYVAAEGASEIALRLAGLAETKLLGDRQAQFSLGGNGVGARAAHLPFLWTETCPPLMAGGTLNLLAATAADAAARLKEKFDVPLSMIAVDTLAAAAGFQDENDNAEAQRAMNVLHNLSRRTGALVLAIDHFGKEAATGTRGASAKEASADVVLALLGQREESGKIAKTRLVTRKVRGGPSGQEFPFRLRIVDLGPDESGSPITTCVVDWTSSLDKQSAPRRLRTTAALDFAIATVTKENAEFIDVDGVRVQAIKKDRVRKAFAKTYGAERNPGAVRTAFKRALEEALAAGHLRSGVMAGEEYVWLANGPF